MLGQYWMTLLYHHANLWLLNLIPFNPYFDETSFLWLSCKIEFDADGGCIPTFGNGIDKSSNPDLYRKCKAHITQNNLDETFQNAAINEIEDEKEYYN